MIDKALIKKYDQALPRYTSYPPANYFHTNFTSDDYAQGVVASNNWLPSAISLYLHIPFCPKLCLYCGCNTLITRREELINEYVVAIKNEMEMVSKMLDLNRTVTQIHWGGGTPNALSTEQIADIMGFIHKTFKIDNNTEVAIECNPAYLTAEYVEELMRLGFNRVSLGIQDFDVNVLKKVNRDPSKLPVEELTSLLRKHNAGVNFDFIYGLPGQTVESFQKSIEKAVGLRPDRLVTFSYAHVPWVKPHQTPLEQLGLPTSSDKLLMYEATYRFITETTDYQPIGLDHYALPTDSLSIAIKNGMLHRNFQGYCTRETTGQVYAFGMSAISQLRGLYAQNTKSTVEYMKLVNSGKLAVERGYKLSDDEFIIGEVITELMCNNFLSWDKTASHLNRSVKDIQTITAFHPDKMKQFVDDGLLIMNDDELTITETGRFTIRNIVSTLDAKLDVGEKRFSKSI